MDSETHAVLRRMSLPDVYLITLDELEKGDEPLLAAKKSRSLIEYYFTCTPTLPLHVLRGWPEVDLIAYLDADLFFFSTPEPIYEEMGTSSILIIGHRFPDHLCHLERFGIYNVGFLAFRRDEPAYRCLEWWRERCLEWCCDKPEGNRFADQKYLDDWPARFPGTTVLRYKGAGLAPWNLANYTLRNSDGGRVVVDEHPLVFFHFQGLRRVHRWIYDSGLSYYQAKLSRITRRNIYIPYIRELQRASLGVSSINSENGVREHSIRYAQVATTSAGEGDRLELRVRDLIHLFGRLAERNLIFVVGPR